MGIVEKTYFALCKMRYRKYPLASAVDEMVKFADWIKYWSNLKVKNVFEIGANYGQDAECLRHCFGLRSKDIFVFEAHPQIYADIKSIHKFNAYNYAVYNKKQIMKFNICETNTGNSGISTLLQSHSRGAELHSIDIPSIRMDEFMEEHGIDRIDFLKLDVEGVNWEVLDGFGNRLKDVGAIHIEAEHVEEFEGEKLWKDIEEKLKANGFVMIYFQRYTIQSDSLWLQEKYLKVD